jgi:hypothetical protein
MFKNRLVLSTLALAIAASAALTTAGSAQADTPARPTASASSVIAPVINTVAPDDSCWD